MNRFPDSPIVKICGLSQFDHVQAANDAGADLVGFVFAPSRRQVNAELVHAIVSELKGNAIPVGLFVDESVDEINASARAAAVELLQVHWRADERDLLALDLPYMLVRRTEPGATDDSVAPDLDRILNGRNPPLRFLIDSYHPGASGGTGVLADWGLAAELARSFPLVLAGGLSPANVADAIESVSPAGVDVSSGVELDGVKSPELIYSFVENARAAFARYSSSEITAHS